MTDITTTQYGVLRDLAVCCSGKEGAIKEIKQTMQIFLHLVKYTEMAKYAFKEPNGPDETANKIKENLDKIENDIIACIN